MKFINNINFLSLVTLKVLADDIDEQIKHDTAFNNTLTEIANDDSADGRKFGSIVDMAFNKLSEHPEFLKLYSEKRAKRKIFHQMIGHYGCHCFPGREDHKGGKQGGRGQPVDQLDQACQKLFRCHKCVNIESPGECDTDFGGYKYQISREVDYSDYGSSGDSDFENGGSNSYGDKVSITCTNPDKRPDCKMHQCQCDKEFADTLYNLWVSSDWTYNSKNWLNNRYVKNALKEKANIFDRESVCLFSGTNYMPDACCGDHYPSKTPYNTANKSCCSAANRPYDTISELCCEELGEVRGMGQQCI